MSAWQEVEIEGVRYLQCDATLSEPWVDLGTMDPDGIQFTPSIPNAPWLLPEQWEACITHEPPHTNEPRDIVDEIDALVDEQMSNYHNRSGYDHNVNRDKCWHCGRDWHGLAVTERIADMYQRRTFDEGYRLAEDDSRVLCHGSDFIGPMPAEPPSSWIDRVAGGFVSGASWRVMAAQQPAYEVGVADDVPIYPRWTITNGETLRCVTTEDGTMIPLQVSE